MQPPGPGWGRLATQSRRQVQPAAGGASGARALPGQPRQPAAGRPHPPAPAPARRGGVRLPMRRGPQARGESGQPQRGPCGEGERGQPALLARAGWPAARAHRTDGTRAMAQAVEWAARLVGSARELGQPQPGQPRTAWLRSGRPQPERHRAAWPAPPASAEAAQAADPRAAQVPGRAPAQASAQHIGQPAHQLRRRASPAAARHQPRRPPTAPHGPSAARHPPRRHHPARAGAAHAESVGGCYCGESETVLSGQPAPQRHAGRRSAPRRRARGPPQER